MRAVVAPLLVLVSACGGASSGGPTTGDATGGGSGSGDGDGGVPANLDPEQWIVPTSECPAAFQSSPPAQGVNSGFTVSGQQRSFVLLLPTSNATGPRPLFVGFNGTSENGSTFSNRADLADFAARGFIVLAPSSIGNGSFWPIWDAMRMPGDEAATNRDLAYFDTLIRCTAAHYNVDKKRIFVGGHSAGGIFTNKVLRSRSDIVAGGIVGSGIWSFTQNAAGSPPLSPFLAIVTWGGDNDEYSGTTPNGVTVPRFSFVEQASLASQYYESQPGVSQVACRGNNIGHAWLPLNAWFADALLSRPKGAPASTPLPPLPMSTSASCSTDAYVLPPAPPVTCGSSSTANCQATCQFMADCLVENQTVGPVMEDQTTNIGITASSCSGCITRCQMATSAADQAVLACLGSRAAQSTCGPGIEGSLPFMQAFNECCAAQPSSALCASTCNEIDNNEAALPFFPVCN